ncbi:hypothetical protein QWI17_11775 [Gilvimarinus sp. SDUM040013]|uniref:DUF1640 domain-containing protein n=1 Tax=Gilvimarinus gilvus TaxID=3058038 RepID=A0ABU4RW34_9GAMM|nr:hypothetical protein [Gilvimarinus sp. SDUM040013]MDO3386514.1 hypothetical protein [Gilvimarinus sp. SDUM040013]MDX6849090.1 hypothetical protein [Gilvimarinus sp. SDUM040013]
MQHTEDQKLTALSQRIDDSHDALKARLDQLYTQREASTGAERDNVEEQIRALRDQEIRLLKSKKAAWMAHWLRTEGEIEVIEHPYRKLGATLMIISVIALMGLATYAWQINS